MHEEKQTWKAVEKPDGRLGRRRVEGASRVAAARRRLRPRAFFEASFDGRRKAGATQWRRRYTRSLASNGYPAACRGCCQACKGCLRAGRVLLSTQKMAMQPQKGACRGSVHRPTALMQPPSPARAPLGGWRQQQRRRGPHTMQLRQGSSWPSEWPRFWGDALR